MSAVLATPRPPVTQAKAIQITPGKAAPLLAVTAPAALLSPAFGAALNLPQALAALDANGCAAHWLKALVSQGLAALPLPGHGCTLQRWQALSQVAAYDLSLAKLFEGHTDALAILAELDTKDDLPGSIASATPRLRAEAADKVTWGIWAAESPVGKVLIEAGEGSHITLHGTKSWCSGAAHVERGLLTAWFTDGAGPQLVQVDMHQEGIDISPGAWRAVGMNGSASYDVAFRGARAQLVGGVGDYLSRPGFWHGGAGVAACWYGGALALAAALRCAVEQSPASARIGFRFAALGKVDLALQSTAAVLREAAAWIDQHPRADASKVALRARLAAEDCAKRVLDETGRALGATAFCRNAHFARAAADLPVFVRQSHGERDFAALGERALCEQSTPWSL
jgi:hypothetical protein